MTDTPNLRLTYVEGSQAQKHVTVNEALRTLDIVVQPTVLDKDLSTPPASPAPGDKYIVGTSATGDWAGHEDKMAAWVDGGWYFAAPKTGWQSYVADEAKQYIFVEGTGWGVVEGGGVANGDAATFTTLTTSDKITATLTDSNGSVNYTGMYIDHNMTGNQALTADRSHIGIHLDIDSSSNGGDTSNEHRIYGIYADMNVSGDSDLVYSIFGYARSTLTTGTTTALKGAYLYAAVDNTGGNIGTAYGSDCFCYVDGVGGVVASAIGTQGRTTISSNHDGNVNHAYGGYFEVEVNGGGGASATNAYGCSSIIDINSATVNTGYLFRGTYQGLPSGTAWGIHLTGDTNNKLAGSLGVGGATADATNVLSVNGTNVLFNSPSGSIDGTFNKNAVANDATFSFKTGFSTKAILGLQGNDDFEIKVGSAFNLALKIAEATGKVSFPSDARFKRRVDLGGRFYMYADNRWIGFNTNYGISTENHSSSFGTGAEPSLSWVQIGVFMKQGEKLTDFEMLNRLSDTELGGFHFRLVFNHGTPGGASWNASGETLRDVVYSEDDVLMSDNGWYKYAPTFNDYTAPADGFLIMCLKSINPPTATGYIYTNGHFSIVTE